MIKSLLVRGPLVHHYSLPVDLVVVWHAMYSLHIGSIRLPNSVQALTCHDYALPNSSSKLRQLKHFVFTRRPNFFPAILFPLLFSSLSIVSVHILLP